MLLNVRSVRMWKVMHGKKYEVPSQNQLVMSGVTHTLINGMMIPHTFHVGFYSLTSPLKMVAIFAHQSWTARSQVARWLFWLFLAHYPRITKGSFTKNSDLKNY